MLANVVLKEEAHLSQSLKSEHGEGGERRLRSEGSSKMSGLTKISAAPLAARGLLLPHQKLFVQYSMTLFHAPEPKSSLHKTSSHKNAGLWRPLGSPEILQTIEAEQGSPQ